MVRLGEIKCQRRQETIRIKILSQGHLEQDETVDVDLFDLKSGDGKHDSDVFGWTEQYG